MKNLFFACLILSATAYAEVWEKPSYTPDENHIPLEREEQQELLEDRQDDKKHQDVKTPQDQIEKDANLEDLEEVDLPGE